MVFFKNRKRPAIIVHPINLNLTHLKQRFYRSPKLNCYGSIGYSPSTHKDSNWMFLKHVIFSTPSHVMGLLWTSSNNPSHIVWRSLSWIISDRVFIRISSSHEIYNFLADFTSYRPMMVLKTSFVISINMGSWFFLRKYFNLGRNSWELIASFDVVINFDLLQECAGEKLME